MPCDFPIYAYRSEQRSDAGKRLLVWATKNSVAGPLGRHDLPCGKCMGCRIDRSEQWATRMMHESQLHPFNCFLTLTYDPQKLPQDYSLNLHDPQSFIKRLRRHAEYNYTDDNDEPLRLRFYLSGEYGDQFGRPHYHAAIFGFDFSDKVFFKRNERGEPLYTSETLTKLWRHGHASTANLEWSSARYIASYVTKKIGGAKEADHYHRQSPIDLKWYNVKPEFSIMSRNPGIGAEWLDRFKSDVFPSGFITVDGRPKPIPRYYFTRLTELEQEALKRDRRKAKIYDPEKSNWRRDTRAKVRNARIKSLKRTLGD